MTTHLDEGEGASEPDSDPAERLSSGVARRWSVAAWLVAAWLLAGSAAGLRLHRRGGIFGEAIPLHDSIAASLINGTPWLFSACVAWLSVGVWPLRGTEVLPAVTAHLGVGLATVTLQQVALAALRTWVLPGELAPADPWGQLPLDLVRWGPVALGVYLVLTGVMLAMRSVEAE